MRIQKICKTCGAEFSVPHWRANAKYCCHDCRQESLKAKPNLTCGCCGKDFHRKPSHIKRYKGNEGFFCSVECAKQGRRIRMSGKGNHQYGRKGDKNASFKGKELNDTNHKNTDIMVYAPSHPYANRSGRVLKHRLVVELNYTLFDSKFFDDVNGTKVLKKKYYVHHIDCNHNNNDINNLMVVTMSEHMSIHNRIYKRSRDSVTGRFIK